PPFLIALRAVGRPSDGPQVQCALRAVGRPSDGPQVQCALRAVGRPSDGPQVQCALRAVGRPSDGPQVVNGSRRAPSNLRAERAGRPSRTFFEARFANSDARMPTMVRVIRSTTRLPSEGTRTIPNRSRRWESLLRSEGWRRTPMAA